MIKGVWDAEYDSAKWFIHLPQLVINVKLNSQIEMAQMVAAAKWIILTTLTTLEQEKLNAFAKNLNCQLIQDIRTCLNSTYFYWSNY